MPCKPKKQKKSMKKYAVGGLLEGPSHEQGGIPLLAEGGEVIVNNSVNNAAEIHEEGLLALNENPENYEIVPKMEQGGRIERNAINRSSIDMLEYINKHGDLPMSDARNRSKK